MEKLIFWVKALTIAIVILITLNIFTGITFLVGALLRLFKLSLWVLIPVWIVWEISDLIND